MNDQEILTAIEQDYALLKEFGIIDEINPEILEFIKRKRELKSVSKQLVMQKVINNMNRHGWDIINHYDRTPMTEIFKPMFDYLEKKGVELK